MSTIDLTALVSFAVIFLNLIYLVWAFSTSVFLQIKNGILLWITVFTFIAVGTIGLQQVMGFYSRFYFVTTGAVNTSPITVPYTISAVILALSLTAISVLFMTKNTRKYIPLRKERDQ